MSESYPPHQTCDGMKCNSSSQATVSFQTSRHSDACDRDKRGKREGEMEVGMGGGGGGGGGGVQVI